jgi:hypothetical protein
MVRELLGSPCWFCSTIALAFVAYGLGMSVYEMIKKRWSLASIAKRLTRIEGKLAEKKTEPVRTKDRPHLRLVHGGKPKKPDPSPPGNVVRADFGKRSKTPPEDPPSGAA